MLTRIGACCLVLLLAGFTTAPLDNGPPVPPDAPPVLADRLLRLHALAEEGGDLPSDEVAEISPELVHFDASGRPRAVRYRLLTSVLLDELQRLTDRVIELEARLEPPAARDRAEPLVRITVVNHE